MNRLRVRFSRGRELKFISHLDIIRLWQRALRRAGIPLAYSEGFNPRPRISLAAPLSVGITSDAELMDIFGRKWVSPHSLASAAAQQLPAGIGIMQVQLVAPSLPSLQSLMREAEYKIEIETEKAPDEIEAAIKSLLSRESLPWQHMRDTGPRKYDLRALISDIWVESFKPPVCTLGMRLNCDSTKGSGRPEQVSAALGFTQYPKAIHRSKLILATG